jgi:phospholipid/cholesterol/gamma-HCH transport system substrate-binding protein
MKRFKVQLRRYGFYAAILALVIVVGTASGFYILLQERLPSPFTTYYTLNGSFSTVTAVVPGLGEPVNVAGVHVGEIAGVQLHGGRGVVTMDIDPGVLPHVYRDAAAALTPNSPLKDMELNIIPGHASAGLLPRGGTIPVSETTTPIDSDELLNSLDSDTRAWFTSAITDLGTATGNRGPELNRLLRALGPSAAEVREIGDQLAARRHEIARLVHNLGIVTRAAASQQQNLQVAADAGDRTLTALASQSAALKSSIEQLPATLATTRRTLADTAAFASVLGPTATALEPTAHRLPSVLHELPTLFKGAALLPAKQAIPFVEAVLPLARMVPPLARTLEHETPFLIGAFKVLEYVVNELAYNPGGANQGFLYWFAWFAHNTNSFLSTEDANGSLWRGMGVVPCSVLNETPLGPLLAELIGTNPNGSC